MNGDPTEFRRVPIEPVDCLMRAGSLTGDQYWLFVGICFVGVLIGSLAPLGILLGPMMCGIYLCYFGRERGYRATFELLFKGFDMVEFGDGRLQAVCRGEKYDPSRHQLKTGVKSATYHMLKVDKEKNQVQVIFDI